MATLKAHFEGPLRVATVRDNFEWRISSVEIVPSYQMSTTKVGKIVRQKVLCRKVDKWRKLGVRSTAELHYRFVHHCALIDYNGLFDCTYLDAV